MTSQSDHKHKIQFDYFSENYSRFEEDYYQYSAFDVPLTFITEDLLLSMGEDFRNYFKLPAQQAKDRRNHYFIFKVTSPEGNPEIRLYEYAYHTLFCPKERKANKQEAKRSRK